MNTYLIIGIIIIVITIIIVTLYLKGSNNTSKTLQNKFNNMYRNSDFDTAVTFHNLDV